MLIPLEECRRLLGERAAGLDDRQLRERVLALETLARWLVADLLAERRQRRPTPEAKSA